MASGRIYGSVTQKPNAYVYYIDWSESGQNASANTSHVNAWVHILCNSHTSYQNNLYQELYIGSQGYSTTLSSVSLSPRNRYHFNKCYKIRCGS